MPPIAKICYILSTPQLPGCSYAKFELSQHTPTTHRGFHVADAVDSLPQANRSAKRQLSDSEVGPTGALTGHGSNLMDRTQISRVGHAIRAVWTRNLWVEQTRGKEPIAPDVETEPDIQTQTHHPHEQADLAKHNNDGLDGAGSHFVCLGDTHTGQVKSVGLRCASDTLQSNMK